jgi:hypothetical protein
MTCRAALAKPRERLWGSEERSDERGAKPRETNLGPPPGEAGSEAAAEVWQDSRRAALGAFKATELRALHASLADGAGRD